MVASWFIDISLRIRSLALTPIASERLRILIGGSSSTCDFRAAATAARWPPRAFLVPERVRRTSSSSTRSVATATGEVTRRSPARSLRRARRPARSATEPRRPVLPLRFVFLLLGCEWRWRCLQTGCRRRTTSRRGAAGRHGAAGTRRPGGGPPAPLRLTGAGSAAGPGGSAARRLQSGQLTRPHQVQHVCLVDRLFRALGPGHGARRSRARRAGTRRAQRGLRPRRARAGPASRGDSRRPPSAPVSAPGRRGPAEEGGEVPTRGVMERIPADDM